MYIGGVVVEGFETVKKEAIRLIKEDSDKILQLINVQIGHLTMPQCPLYEEVLDTQMFGLSRQIDFAVRLGVLDGEEGKKIMSSLEQELSNLYDKFTK